MKIKTKVNIFYSESCAYNLPDNPKEFIAWWQEKFDLVPEEYRDTTIVDCSTAINYDSSTFEVSIFYYRLETDEEEAARLEENEVINKRIKERELLQYKKLKDKYRL